MVFNKLFHQDLILIYEGCLKRYMIDLYVSLMQRQECVGVGAKYDLKYLNRVNQDLIYLIK